MSNYEIAEKDIMGMLKHLRVFHPENANREFAVEMLEYLKTTYHTFTLADPATLEELYEAFSDLASSRAIINEIAAHHQVFGSLCYEAHDSYMSEHYTAALCCLFVLIELVLKYKLDINPDDNMGLHKAIEGAASLNVISKSEQAELHRIRELRNIIFHENHYENILEINGLLCPIYEDETKKLLYEHYSMFVFELVESTTTD
jgi:hypothetical protein